MNDQVNEEVPEGVEPPRLKFYEEVQQAFQNTVNYLCANVPEFSGAAVSLVWDLESSRDLPHGLILGRKTKSPQFTLRAAEQTNKTLQNLAANFSTQLVAGDEAAQELNDKLAAARQELDGLQQKIEEKRRVLTSNGPDNSELAS